LQYRLIEFFVRELLLKFFLRAYCLTEFIEQCGRSRLLKNRENVRAGHFEEEWSGI